jgi:hypothetical protein
MKKTKKSVVGYTVPNWKSYLLFEKFGNRSLCHSWICKIKSPLHPKKVKITLEELK